MKTQTDFQHMSDELDAILEQFQSGELTIDQATEAFERGMQLVGKLEKYLKTAENKVIKVKANFSNNKE